MYTACIVRCTGGFYSYKSKHIIKNKSQLFISDILTYIKGKKKKKKLKLMYLQTLNKQRDEVGQFICYGQNAFYPLMYINNIPSVLKISNISIAQQSIFFI